MYVSLHRHVCLDIRFMIYKQSVVQLVVKG